MVLARTANSFSANFLYGRGSFLGSIRLRKKGGEANPRRKQPRNEPGEPGGEKGKAGSKGRGKPVYFRVWSIKINFLKEKMTAIGQ